MLNPNESMTAFEKLVNLMRKDKLSTFLAAFLIMIMATFGGAGYYGYTYMKSLESRLAPSPIEETESFHKSILTSDKINKIIERSLVDLKASKVLVASFHNNKKALDGMPWNFYSIRFAAKVPELSYDISESQDIHNTQYSELYAKMWKADGSLVCISTRPQDIQSSILRDRVENRASKVFFTCPLQSKNGVPLGWISVTYNFNNIPPFPETEILSYLDGVKGSITPLLEHVLVK